MFKLLIMFIKLFSFDKQMIEISCTKQISAGKMMFENPNVFSNFLRRLISHVYMCTLLGVVLT